MIPAELESSIIAAEEKVCIKRRKKVQMSDRMVSQYCTYTRLYYKPQLSFPQGLVPFYVNATAGTTVYGAFDPLNDIADICHKHTLWMHVDVS